MNSPDFGREKMRRLEDEKGVNEIFLLKMFLFKLPLVQIFPRIISLDGVGSWAGFAIRHVQ